MPREYFLGHIKSIRCSSYKFYIYLRSWHQNPMKSNRFFVWKWLDRRFICSIWIDFFCLTLPIKITCKSIILISLFWANVCISSTISHREDVVKENPNDTTKWWEINAILISTLCSFLFYGNFHRIQFIIFVTLFDCLNYECFKFTWK